MKSPLAMKRAKGTLNGICALLHVSANCAAIRECFISTKSMLHFSCEISAKQNIEPNLKVGGLYAYIQDLMVHPGYQGRGIGTALMQKMIACLKEKHICMISVIFEESLKTFYEKFGFFCMLSGQMETCGDSI